MRLKIRYQNLEKTEAIETYTAEKFSQVIEKFRESERERGDIRLEMLNSPEHAGKDLYLCKIVLKLSKSRHWELHKKAENLYEAIAECADSLAALLSKEHKLRVNQKQKRISLKRLSVGLLSSDYSLC